MTDVSVRELSVAYDGERVLRELDLDIASGEFIVLLGPSGCGKSTLLNAVAGLLDVDDGEVWIGGRNVTWDEPKDRGIGMVFQSYALYPRMTVTGNLSFGLKMAGTEKDEIRRRVDEAARLLHIEDLLARRPGELSGGQRQRVAIGRALVRDAGVFLFDEPLSNLDAALRTELRVELKRLHKALRSTTMIYVTHDQVEALTLADRMAVMNGGVIQQLDSPRAVYSRPANRFVAGFVGSPRMNFVRGVLSRREGVPTFVAKGLALPLHDYVLAAEVNEGQPIELGIRPEHLSPSGGQGLPLVVDLVEPMGAESLVWCTLGEHTLSVRLDGDATVSPGDTLHVMAHPQRLNLFDGDTGERL